MFLFLDPGNERFKCTFTIRDSPSDFINVTCWGSEEFIRKIHTSFKICDVGESVLLSTSNNYQEVIIFTTNALS